MCEGFVQNLPTAKSVDDAKRYIHEGLKFVKGKSFSVWFNYLVDSYLKEEKEKNESVIRKLMRDNYILKKAVLISNNKINEQKCNK